VVLCYHGIFSRQKERFRRQMAHIHSRAVRIDDSSEHGIHAGKCLKVYLTFDDAFANLLDNALPVMEQYQISSVIFAVADNLGCEPRWQLSAEHPESNESTITAEQLESLTKNSLIRIGSHTLTHPDLKKIFA